MNFQFLFKNLRGPSELCGGDRIFRKSSSRKADPYANPTRNRNQTRKETEKSPYAIIFAVVNFGKNNRYATKRSNVKINDIPKRSSAKHLRSRLLTKVCTCKGGIRYICWPSAVRRWLLSRSHLIREHVNRVSRMAKKGLIIMRLLWRATQSRISTRLRWISGWKWFMTHHCSVSKKDLAKKWNQKSCEIIFQYPTSRKHPRIASLN